MSFTTAITLCYQALFLLTPFVFTWSNSELFEFNKMLFVWVIATLVGGLWLTRMVVEKKVIWNKHPLGLLMLVFLAGQLLATIFSIHFRTSIFGYYSRLNGGLLSSLAYTVLLLGLLQHVPREKRWSLLLTNAVAALFVSFYAIPEHFGASPSCFLMHGEIGIDCWRQNVQERVFATFGQPNWLAAYLAGLAPLAWILAQRSSGKRRWFWLVGLTSMLLAIWYSKSRSGILAVGVAGVTLAVLHTWPQWRGKIKQVLRAKKHWLWLWAGAVGVFLLSALGVQRFLATQPDPFDLSQGTESGSIRLIVWRGALKVWQRYPLTGSGPGTFAYSYYQDRPIEHNVISEWDHLYNKAHNELLNYLAETGVVGLVTYSALVAGSLFLLGRSAFQSPRADTAAQAVLAGVVGVSVAHFFGFSTVMSNVLLFLLPGIVFLSPEHLPPTTKRKRLMRLWQKLALVLIGLTTLLVLIKLGTLWRADWWYARGRRLQTEQEYPAALVALRRASELTPAEPLYYDELADLFAQLALQYHLSEEATASAELTEAALQNSDYALLLNPRHLDFYKTRARVFLFLSQIDQQYLVQQQRTLKAALTLAPTDAQLWYNLGLAQYNAGQFNEAAETLHKTVELKPNYVRARSELGNLLIELGRVEEGRAQYRFILEKLSPSDTVIREKLEGLEDHAN